MQLNRVILNFNISGADGAHCELALNGYELVAGYSSCGEAVEKVRDMYAAGVGGDFAIAQSNDCAWCVWVRV